jgi:hypothetical protein
MDAITLDHLIAEARLALAGRHCAGVKLVAANALLLEVSGDRSRRLWLDAGRGTAGAYLLSRDEARAEQEDEASAPGRTRQALLHFRKHLDGARITDLNRVPGERTLVLETSRGVVSLRLSGQSPALTLAVEGAALATVGEGGPAWPLPPAAPEREWDHIEPRAFALAVAEGVAAGRTLVRAILGACPSLGPVLARSIDGSAESFVALRARLAGPRPTLLTAGPIESLRDADLAGPDAVVLAPIVLERPDIVALQPPTWSEAAALFLRARRRGARFEARRRSALDSMRRELRRLVQLEAHLTRDLAGLADPAALRHQAEALLAAPSAHPGAAETDVPDPYDADRRLRIALDPALALPANADRLFQRARRIERARENIEARLSETRRALGEARSREARVSAARDVAELEAAPARGPRGLPGGTVEEPAGQRHYLTSRGLSILVGRGARENHHLTFRVARPEDVWLHARDVPGAHVILRDPEGRAGADDLREAAEIAAFFSDARSAAKVDVHVTRRKHLRPARGTPGRVLIGHSDTLRVAPHDPDGRLRRR